MRAYIVSIVAIIGFLTFAIYHINEIHKYKEQVNLEIANRKAYDEQLSGKVGETRNYQLTIESLKVTNDRVAKELDSLRNVLKIKDKYIKSLGKVQIVGTRTDTIRIPQFVNVPFNIDTIIGDEWLNTYIKIDTTLQVQQSFKSKVNIITNIKRETINPPKKFFLFRLFQKKHDVVVTNVIEENPYAEIKEQKFIDIVK